MKRAEEERLGVEDMRGGVAKLTLSSVGSSSEGARKGGRGQGKGRPPAVVTAAPPRGGQQGTAPVPKPSPPPHANDPHARTTRTSSARVGVGSGGPGLACGAGQWLMGWLCCLVL